MLLGVEVVESFLEGKKAIAVTCEHQYEAAVPHENIAVVGSVDIRANKTRALGNLSYIAYSYFPGAPIHFELFVMPGPHGIGQYLTGFGKGARNDSLGLFGAELILGRKNLFYICILIWKFILHVVAARLGGGC